jgi:hypothetical protein
MSKKYALLFMTLFLTAAGAFYYEGAPQDAKATEEKSSVKTEVDAEKAESKPANADEETVDSAVKETEKPKAAPPSAANKNTEQKSSADLQQETSQKEDTIIIDGRVYESIMDEEKFAHMSRVASKYGAILYGLPETDSLVIAKNGEPIVQMSTGIKNTSTEYASLLSELFSEGFEEYKRIEENILFAAETNANVRVDFGDYIAYSITVNDGKIRVTW